MELRCINLLLLGPPKQCKPIGHVRYINILTWLPGFLVKLLYLALFSLHLSLFWELEDKRNLQFWPEILTQKLRSHAWILIYWTWPIRWQSWKNRLNHKFSNPANQMSGQVQNNEISVYLILMNCHAQTISYRYFPVRKQRYFTLQAWLILIIRMTVFHCESGHTKYHPYIQLLFQIIEYLTFSNKLNSGVSIFTKLLVTMKSTTQHSQKIQCSLFLQQLYISEFELSFWVMSVLK